MALLDANYKFLHYNVYHFGVKITQFIAFNFYYNAGTNGRCNNASVFNESVLAKLLQSGELDLQEPRPLSG